MGKCLNCEMDGKCYECYLLGLSDGEYDAWVGRCIASDWLAGRTRLGLPTYENDQVERMG
jgi:hypothetical protein